jgi:hypothetical protein
MILFLYPETDTSNSTWEFKISSELKISSCNYPILQENDITFDVGFLEIGSYI